MQIVSSGIQGLDAQLGGGFLTGSTILSISEPSNAPHIMNEQFAAAGLNEGQTVYFYSMERPKEDVVDHVKRYLDRDVFAKLVFFDAYSVKLRGVPSEALAKLGVTNHAINVSQDVVPRMLEEDPKKPFRLVVESLTESIAAYGEEATMTMVEGIAGITRKTEAITLLTLTKGVTDPRFERKVEHLVDGVIEFGVDRQGFGLYSYLSITKMRGVQEATKLLLYKETEKGLWLESTRRVF